jgi:hypothetical protein
MQLVLKYLNINVIFITLLVSILGYGITSYYFQKPDPYEIPTGNLPVPIQVGKNKIIVSKTGDASMRTEYKRRRAIIGSNSCGITPKFSHSGSTNGSMETYFLSSMCPTFVKDAVNQFIVIAFDAGNADSDFTGILDGNEPYDITIDGGDADTNSFTM